MKIAIHLEAHTGSFETDFKRASKTAEQAAKRIREEWSKVGVVLGASIAAGTAALAALAKSSINAAAALADMSQKVGVSVETLSTLGFAAQQSDVEIEKLQAGLVKLAKNASDAAQGTGEAVNGFAALGISVKNADGSLKGTDVLLREIATKFSGFADGANKTALAVNLFGRSGAELIPLLNEGADGIAELEERARSLGLEMSSQTAVQAEALGDQIDQLGALARGLGNDITAAVVPSLLGFTEGLVQVGIEGRNTASIATTIKKAVDFLLVTFIKGVEAVQNIGAAFAFLVDVIHKADDAITASGKNFSLYFSGLKDALSGNLASAAAKYREIVQNAAQIGADLAEGIRASGDALKESFAANAAEAEVKIASIAEASLKLGEGLEATAQGALAAAPPIRNLAKAEAEAAKAAAELDKRNRDYSKFLDRAAKEQERWIKRQREANAATQARFAEQEKALRDEISLLGLSATERERQIVAIEAERLARDHNGVAIDAERQKLEKLLAQLRRGQQVKDILEDIGRTQFSDLIERVRILGEELKEAMNPARVEQLSGAITSLNAQIGSEGVGAFRAFLGAAQTLTKEGSTGFRRMEQAMAVLSVAEAALATQAAVTAILTQGKGEPYSAWARMAAMAAAVAPLLASIGAAAAAFGGGGGSNVAANRQERQGTGTVLGDLDAKSESMVNAMEITAEATQELVGINRGMLNALQAMQRGIGAASSSLARVGFSEISLNEATGPLLDRSRNTFAGRVFGSIFGGDQDLIDQGLLIGGGTFGNVSRNPNASTFQTIETDGGWFHSDDIEDELEALGEAATNQIRLILTSIGDAVREGALALGLSAEEVDAAIEAFRIAEIRISTMDLSAEEAQAELEAVFSSIFDNMAGAVVPFIDQFQRVGEGLGETLVRVATSVQVVQEGIFQLGLSLDTLDPEHMAQVSVALIEAAGGIEEFISGMTAFVNNFAPEAHQFAIAQDSLTRGLQQVGLVLPTTRDGFWQLMQSLDATTESGRAQIATLLRLAGVADDYYDMVEDRAEGALDAAQAMQRAVHDYAEFVMQFGEDSGTPFQRALRELRKEFDANIATAHELARAAGLQAARTEDLARIEAAYFAQRELMIADLAQTIRDQIATLYGTPIEAIEQQIAGIDEEIAGLDAMRSEGTFGLIMAQQREAQLQADRAGLVQQLEQARKAEEALRRQTGALDLARNLADLGLARGLSFRDLAREFGLDVTRFGADLGMTADEIDALILQLQEQAFTAESYSAGVDRIVEAIESLAEEPGGDIGRPNLKMAGEVLEPGSRNEDLLVADEIRTLREVLVTVLQHGQALDERATQQIVTTIRTGALDPNTPRGVPKPRFVR